MKEENQKIVHDFIDAIKRKDKKEIAGKIQFPFEREYPIPEVKTETDFINRYNEIFDDSLSMLISQSTIEDWTEMGWRGIMFLNGEVWLNYGDGIILGINYQSKVEQTKKIEMIQVDKNRVHASIKNFERPVHVLKTNNYLIRVDDVGKTYRYASWPLNAKMTKKPDLIIEKGKLEYWGSGGNHTYTFKKGGYTYECYISILSSEGEPPATLKVYKKGIEILSQPAEIITDVTTSP
jgi:hypothetical protein